MDKLFQLIITSRSDVSGLEKTEQAVKDVNRATDTMNEKQALTRREWMRTGSEAAFYARSVLGSTGAMSKGLSETIGLVTQLGESFMFGGVMGVTVAGIAALVGLITKQVQEQKAAVEALKAPYQEIRKEIEALATLKGLDRLAKELGVTREQLEGYIKSGSAGAETSKQFADAQGQAAVKTAELERAQRLLREAQANASKAGVAENIDTLIQADATKALREDITRLANQRAALTLQMRGSVSATEADKKALEDHAAVAKLEAQLEKELRDAINDRAAAMRNASTNLAKAQTDIVKDMLSGMFTPTAVTQDQMLATSLGKYKDQWDELARQADDVAINPANIAKYSQLAAALDKTGLSAKEFAASFRDMSLFADPQNLGFLNMEPIIANVEKQIDQMLGSVLVKEKAFGDVMAKLPKEARDKLEALGISKLSDIDKTTLRVGLAPDFAAVVQSARDTILSNIPKEMSTTVYVSYKTDTGGGAGSPPPGAVSSETGGKFGTAPAYTAMAEGGYGTVSKSGLIWIDQGEKIWASGTRGQVPPPMSNVQISASVRNEMDIEKLSRAIARRLKG